MVILETPSGKLIKTLTREGLDGGIRYLAVLPDGRLVAASRQRRRVGLESKVGTGRGPVPTQADRPSGADMERVAVNVNGGDMPARGATIAFATSDGIMLWDAEKRAVQKKMGTGPMYSVAWSLPLHRLIATQGDRVAIYDEPSGELLASQIIWYGPGKHLFLSPEGHIRCLRQ